MDGFSAAASIIGVIEVAAKVGSHCAKYAQGVHNAPREISDLEAKTRSLEAVLREAGRLEANADVQSLRAIRAQERTFKQCRSLLASLDTRLEAGSP